MDFPFHDNIKKNERIKVFDERMNRSISYGIPTEMETLMYMPAEA
jgi:hypothetical protein